MDLSKGGFKRNFLLMFSVKLYAVVLTILTTPILSRLFSPTEYGTYAIYNTIIQNFVILSTLGYGDALLIAKNREEYKSIFQVSHLFLSVFLIGFIALLPYIPAFFDSNSIFEDFKFNVLLVLGAFLASVLGIYQKFNVYENKFGFAARQGAFTQTITRMLSILLGLKNVGVGLIISDVAGKLYSTVTHFFNYFALIRFFHFSQYSLRTWSGIVKKYRSYPFFIFPSNYLNLISGHLPIFIIGGYFGVSEVGQYSMAIGLVLIPINLLGNSLFNVIVQRMKDESNVGIQVLIDRLIKWLVLITIVPVVVLSFFTSEILPFILGEDWILAGRISDFLILMVTHQVLNISLSGLFQIKNYERQQLYFHLVSFVVLLAFCFCALAFDLMFIELIAGISGLRILLATLKIQFLLYKLSVKSWYVIGFSALLIFVIFLKI